MRNRWLPQWMVGFFVACILTVCFLVPASAKETVKLAYVEWSSEIASTHLVQAVLQEKMGYNCQIIPMEADEMWQAVAEGKVDAMVAAWLPGTHGHYYQEYKDQLVNLGPNLKGTKIGLVVPNVTVGRQTAASGQRNEPYISVDSISELKHYADKFQHKIIGIDPAAGVMQKTREAMDVYGLDSYRLVSGSEISMTAELANAVQRHKWIVVTGWVPHWMFARWSLKFLEDPKNVYGGREHINTIAREGLQQDMPEVFAFLDRFNWTPEDMAQLMIWIQGDDGMYPYESAQRFMRANPELIESWLP